MFVKIAQVFGNMKMGNGAKIFYIVAEMRSNATMQQKNLQHFIVPTATVLGKFAAIAL